MHGRQRLLNQDAKNWSNKKFIFSIKGKIFNIQNCCEKRKNSKESNMW